MSVCRGIRGATTASVNRKESILAATGDLVRELVKAESIKPHEVDAAIFTTTRGLIADGRILPPVKADVPAEKLANACLKGAKSLRARGAEA